MNIIEALFQFEEKYKFLYDEMVSGVAVYTCLRDAVGAYLTNQAAEETGSRIQKEKGRIYPRRILDTFLKWRKYRNRKTLIFTSSVYRRDKGRNLAAEFLLQKYPDGVIFEWPSRNNAFDDAYFQDTADYVPLDGYLVLYKLYSKLCRREMWQMEEDCREKLQRKFEGLPPETEAEKRAVEYLLTALPNSVATTAISQRIFKWMFRNYKNVQYAVDFWGSGRENIIPVLPGKPQSIELQHGIITPTHPGYIYPEFVKASTSSLFGRTILVYGDKERAILTQKSVYVNGQIEVIGNPRIQMYRKRSASVHTDKKWILFTSQPYEKDVPGSNYYAQMLAYLDAVNQVLVKDGRFRLAIKLHPRENNAAKMLYQDTLPGVPVFDNSSELYMLFAETYLHLTATSTTLFEALEFDVPTVTIQFGSYDPYTIFGLTTFHLNNHKEFSKIWNCLREKDQVERYLYDLKKQLSKC